MRSRAILRDSASLASGQIALLAAAAVTGLLSARWLGPAGKGELALAFAVVALLGPIAAGGVDTFIASRSSTLPPEQRRALHRFALNVGWAGGIGLAAVTVLYGTLMGLGFALLLLTAGAALFRPPVAVRQALRISDDRVSELGWVALAMAVGQVVLVGGLAVGGATTSDFAIAAAAALLLGLVLLSRRGSSTDPGAAARLDRATRRDVARFGGATVLADGLQLANYRIDLFILAVFVSLPTIGVYAVAVTLAEILWQVPNAVSRSVLARVAQGEVVRADVIRIACRLGLVTGALAVVGVAGTHLLVTPLLGDSYAEVPELLALLLPGVVVLGATKPLAAWTLSRGYPGRNLAASAGGFVLVIAANLVLIPEFGAVGAAFASTLSYATTAVAIVVLLPAGAAFQGDAETVPTCDGRAPAVR